MATRTVVDYNTRFVVVMQRLSESDTTNAVLEKGGYVHLCLPMEYDPKIQSRLPKSEPNPLGWSDPRQTTGELLFPKAHTKTSLAPNKKYSHLYASQYQQLPSPMEGLIFKTDKFRRYTDPVRVNARRVSLGSKTFSTVDLSLDCSFKEADESSYVVVGVWGGWLSDYYLFEVVRKQMGLFDTLDVLLGLYKRYRIGKTYVERAANGHAVIEAMKRAKLPVVEVEVCESKRARAYAIQPVVQDGRIWVPEDGATEWIDEYINEMGGFPHSIHDDQVDMTTQIIAEFEQRSQVHRAYKAFTAELFGNRHV
jgi:predicted phage terminase large subunit-like protein